MFNHRKNTLAWSTLGIIALGYAGSAIADDGKTYPATFCVERNDAAPELVYGLRGRAANSGAAAEEFVCPALSDTGERVTSARIVVEDGHRTQSVSCRLESISDDGSVVASSDIISSPSGVATRTLTFPALSAADDLGATIIRCTVPGLDEGAASALVTYQVVEDE